MSAYSNVKEHPNYELVQSWSKEEFKRRLKSSLAIHMYYQNDEDVTDTLSGMQYRVIHQEPVDIEHGAAVKPGIGYLIHSQYVLGGIRKEAEWLRGIIPNIILIIIFLNTIERHSQC